MEFDLFGGGANVEYSGVGFVEISSIFVTQDDFYDATEPFDGIVRKIRTSVRKNALMCITY